MERNDIAVLEKELGLLDEEVIDGSPSSDDENDQQEQYNDDPACSNQEKEQTDTVGSETGWSYDLFSGHGVFNFGGDQNGKRIVGTDAVHITYLPGNDLLGKYKTESSQVLSNARSTLGVPNTHKLTPLDALHAALPPRWKEIFADWLNSCSSQSDDFVQISHEDILHYMLVEVAMRARGHSYAVASRSNAWTPDDAKGFLRVRKAMALDKPCQPVSPPGLPALGLLDLPDAVSSHLAMLQDDAQQHFTKLFFVPGITCVQMHVDKCHSRQHISNEWERYSTCADNAKKGRHQANIHLSLSVATGCVLQGFLESARMKTKDIITRSLQQLLITGTDETQLMEPPQREKLVICVDREYLESTSQSCDGRRTNILQMLIHNGVRFIGEYTALQRTPMPTRSFPFPEPRPPAASSGDFCKYTSTRACRFYQASCQLQDGSNIGAILFERGDGKDHSSRLVTNQADLLQQEWSYDVKTTDLKADHPGGVRRLPHRKSSQSQSDPGHIETTSNVSSSTLLDQMETKLYQLALAQNTPDWKLQCYFRATSITAFVSMKFENADFIHTRQLTALHKYVKDLACLCPKRSLKVDPVEKASTERGQKRKHSAEIEEFTASFWSQKLKTRANLEKKLLELDKNASLQGRNLDLANRIAHTLSNTAHSVRESRSAQINKEPAVYSDGNNSDDEEELGDQDVPLNVWLARQEQKEGEHGDLPAIEQGNDDVDSGQDITGASSASRQALFLKTVLKSWFCKSNILTNHSLCVISHSTFTPSARENILIHNMKSFVERVSNGRLKIDNLRGYGLLARRDMPFLAAAPDGTGVLLESQGDNDFSVDGAFALKINMYNSSTQQTELESRFKRLGALRQCQCGTYEFRSLVPSPSQRAQYIHLAAVLDVPITLIINSTATETLQLILLRVSETERAMWRTYLDTLQKEYLKFAYGPELQPMPEVAPRGSKIFGFARDHYTVELHLQLWRRHYEDIVLNGTPPPCTKFLPKIVSSFSQMAKQSGFLRSSLSGSVVTKTSLSLNSLIWTSFFSYILYNAYRIYQLSLVDRSGKEYNSFEELMRERSRFYYRGFLEQLLSAMHLDMAAKKNAHIAGDQPHNMLVTPASNSLVIGPVQPTSSSSEDAEHSMHNSGDVKRKAYRYKRLPELLKMRFELPREHHRASIAARGKPAERRKCILCCQKCDAAHRGNEQAGPHSRVARTSTKWCVKCKAVFCQNCFDKFHNDKDLVISHYPL